MIQPTPNPSGSVSAGFVAVSCPGATHCEAVGGYSTVVTGADSPLAEEWNGTKWSEQTIPTPAGGAGLSAVSCPSATSCTAIGDSGGVSGVTLAEGWNGSTWTIESTPKPNGYSFPLGISCTTVTSCTSTGEYFPDFGGTTATLAYQLN